jgi:RNA polymerase sigma-70 factor (ECF subfamily)
VNPVQLDTALAAARAGDEEGFANLYRELNPSLLRYLSHHVGGAAEDVASEVWLATWRRLGEFDGTGADFRAFLFMVARRRAVDDHRRRRRRPVTLPFGPSVEPVAGDDPAELVTFDLTAREAIRALTRSLPKDQADVVLLRVVADLSVDEVARIMGRSPGSVRVLQHRALRRLAGASKKLVTR